MSYHWDKKQVVLERLEQSTSLEMITWFELLAKIDLVFSNVLPIGSVIEVDGEKRPQNLGRSLKVKKMGSVFIYRSLRAK